MWHYLKNNQSVGPVDEAGIIQLIHAGVVTRETQVWTDGMAAWAPLASTPLARHFVAISPAPGEMSRRVLPGWANPVGGVVGAVLGYLIVRVAMKNMSAETLGMFIGGGVAGALCGLLPYLIGRKRARKLASVSMVCCVICGLILGVILALPVAVVFTIIIVSQKSNAAG